MAIEEPAKQQRLPDDPAGSGGGDQRVGTAATAAGRSSQDPEMAIEESAKPQRLPDDPAGSGGDW